MSFLTSELCSPTGTALENGEWLLDQKSIEVSITVSEKLDRWSSGKLRPVGLYNSAI